MWNRVIRGKNTNINFRGSDSMTYKAEYENEVFEIILADNDNEAIEQARDLENEHGTLFNVFLLDDHYNVIRTVF